MILQWKVRFQIIDKFYFYHLFQYILKAAFLITVLFPQDIFENGIKSIIDPENFCLMGLGDIIVPGLFIAILLRFDQRYVVELIN